MPSRSCDQLVIDRQGPLLNNNLVPLATALALDLETVLVGRVNDRLMPGEDPVVAGRQVRNQNLSTAALHSSLRTGKIELTPATTIIHDEAALASTRELWPLLAHAEVSGARLILVGDPHQNQPVGAGGLWRHVERAADDSGAHASLTGNVRALNPDDRRDQALFRAGEHAAALHGYADRGRVHLRLDQASAEDAALEAAHTAAKVDRERC